MAQTTTEWVLNFKDRATAAVSKLYGKVKDSVKSVKKLGDVWQLTDKETRKALTKAKDDVKGYRANIAVAELTLKKMQKELMEMGHMTGSEFAKAQDAISKQRQEIERLKEQLAQTSVNALTLQRDLDGLSTKGKTNWTRISVQVNQLSEVINKVSRSLDFAVSVRSLKTQVQRMTDLADDALYAYLKRSREIAAVYGQDAEQVATAVNVMTQQMGGSFRENFDLLEEGFTRGANLSGSLLANMENYSGAFAEMGIKGSEAMVILAKAEKEGVDADVAIRSIKEAGDALVEMTGAKEKALAGIGIGMEELKDKTVWESIQTVSQAMDGMSEQAKQSVVSKVFGKAGRDSGVSFVQGLSEELPDLSELPAVKETASGFKRLFSNITTWAGSAFGGLATHLQQLTPAVQLIAGAIPILGVFGKFVQANIVGTKAWTFATKALGRSFLGLPIIGWIAAIVTALIVVSSTTEGWGKAWKHTIEGMKLLMQSFVLKVKAGFTTTVNGLMLGIDKIKLGWYKFKQAVGLGDSDENQAMIDKIQGDVEKRSEAIIEAQKEANKADRKMLEAAINFTQAGKSIKWKSKKEDSLGVSRMLDIDPAKRLSFDEEDGTKKKGKSGQKDGLNVGSGAGGVKSIAMTLNVENHFDVDKNTNIRNIADQIVAMVNDRLKDSLVTIN